MEKPETLREAIARKQTEILCQKYGADILSCLLACERTMLASEIEECMRKSSANIIRRILDDTLVPTWLAMSHAIPSSNPEVNHISKKYIISPSGKHLIRFWNTTPDEKKIIETLFLQGKGICIAELQELLPKNSISVGANLFELIQWLTRKWIIYQRGTWCMLSEEFRQSVTSFTKKTPND